MTPPDLNIPQCETLWNSLPVPAFVTDRSGLVLDANTGAELLMNRPVRRLKGRNLSDILCKDNSLITAFSRARDDHGPVYISKATLIPGAGDEDADIQLATITGDENRLLVLVQPHRFAGKIGRGEAVKSAARSAIGMAEMLAHEIKNPLAGITGAAQLLAMSLSRQDQELTDLIVAESRRIVALLEQVEQFGNLQPPARKVVNIHDLLDRAQKSAELGFARNMRFEQVYDPSLPATFVDEFQMLQVLQNLMKNATEAAGPGGGTITLKTSYDQGLRMRAANGQGQKLPLQVEIIDNGPGIAQDMVAQVFEPFVSGRENGTGLGLALVSKIMADHGAWISLDSAPGRTCFRLSLPVATEGTE